MLLVRTDCTRPAQNIDLPAPDFENMKTRRASGGQSMHPSAYVVRLRDGSEGSLEDRLLDGKHD